MNATDLTTKTKKLIADFDVREKTGVIVGIIVAWMGLNLAVAFFINVPRAQRVQALDEAVVSAAAALSTRTNDVTNLREHHARVIAGRTSLEVFYSEILSTKQERLISFQREIREIAKKFNINLETIGYRREPFTEDKVAKFTATMPLTGSYENLREFVDMIERSENFVIIDSIQLASSKEGGIILSLMIQLSTYFVDEDIQADEDQRRLARG